MNHNQSRVDEQLFHLGQLLDDEASRIIRQALLDYALQTLGRERSIAFQLAHIFA